MARWEFLKTFTLVYLVLGGHEDIQRVQAEKLTPEYWHTAPKDKLFPNLGITYKEVGKLQPTHEVYNIHLMVDLPDILTLIREISEVIPPELMKSCKATTSVAPEICQEQKVLIDSLFQYQERIKNEMTRFIEDLVNDIPALKGRIVEKPIWLHNRPKRGFGAALFGIPLIGGLIYGLYTSHRIGALEKNIKTLRNVSFRLAEGQSKLSEGLSMLANVTAREIHTLYRQIGTIRSKLINLTYYVRTSMKTLQKKISDSARLEAYLSVIQLTLTEYHIVVGRMLKELRLVVHNLHLGLLPQTLVTYNQLQTLLDKVGEDIRNKYPGYSLVYKQAEAYYNVRNVIATVLNRTLIVQISAYVKKENQAMFDLYRVESVPVPYNVHRVNQPETGEKSYSYTQAEIKTPYFAASTEDYMTMSSSLIASCEENNGVYICPDTLIHTHKSQPTCLSAVYWEQSIQEIDKHCQYQYYHDIIPEARILSNYSHYLISNGRIPWTLVCEGQSIPKRKSGERYVLIERAALCQCALVTPVHYVPATLTDCRKETTEIKLLYPYNAIVRYKFAEQAQEAFNYLNAERENVGEDMPELRVIDTTSEEHVPNQEKLEPIELDQVVQAIKNNKPAYISRMDYLESHTDVRNWFSGKKIILGIILIMSTVGVIALIIVLAQLYQSGKIKGLLGTTLMSQGIPMTEAVQLNDQGEDIYSHLAAQLTLDRFMLIVTVVSVVLLYYLSKYLFKRYLLYRHIIPSRQGSKARYTQMFLEITNMKESILIHVMKVPASVIEIEIPGKLNVIVKEVRKYYWYTYVHLKWNIPHFYVYSPHIEMPFPNIITIPLYRRAKLQRIIDTPYTTRILVLNDVYYSVEMVRSSRKFTDEEDVYSIINNPSENSRNVSEIGGTEPKIYPVICENLEVLEEP